MSGECEWRDVDAGYRCERPALLARIAAVEALCATGELCLDPDCEDEDGSVVHVSEVRAVLAASPTPTGPEPATDMCHNGHPFAPGIDVDMEAEGRAPDPRWCNVCGDTRPGPATPEPTEETP